jgi:hypothetical protein
VGDFRALCAVLHRRDESCDAIERKLGECEQARVDVQLENQIAHAPPRL